MTGQEMFFTGDVVPADPDFVRFQRENLAMIAKAFGCCSYEEVCEQLRRPSFEEIMDQIINERLEVVTRGLERQL